MGDSEISEIKGKLASVEASVAGLQVKFASLEGAVLTELRHLVHDVKNLDTKLGVFVPRNEVESTQVDHERRLEKIESGLTKVVWAVVTGWIGGVSTWLFFGSKIPPGTP